MRAIYETNEKGLTLRGRGKVRDVYGMAEQDQLLIITTDRISAYDHILPTPVPHKGLVLNQISNFWFEATQQIIPNHLINGDPFAGDTEHDDLVGRCAVVRKATPLPVEAIVRGCLAGSAWKEYRTTGRVNGLEMPKGLLESSRLPEPLFTPTTKAPAGEHDQPMSLEAMADLLGADLAQKVVEKSLELYRFAARHAEACGLILADAKLEFGVVNDDLVLIDELFTPDSSRYWDLASYAPGRSQASFDKQFVRDYLDAIGWNHQAPAPALPADVVNKTSRKYLDALDRLVLSRPAAAVRRNIKVVAA